MVDQINLFGADSPHYQLPACSPSLAGSASKAAGRAAIGLQGDYLPLAILASARLLSALPWLEPKKYDATCVDTVVNAPST